jgi:hypothetical protein
MMAAALPQGPRNPRRQVVALAARRIERALARRERYRYVQPRVEALNDSPNEGWKIVSPNCSRNIDSAGGEIEIAWLVCDAEGRWRLHARDHAVQAWRLMDQGLSLQAALSLVCRDPLGVYWP